MDDEQPVIGSDGYPRRGHTETLAGRRVWQIDTDGMLDTLIEGHGEAAAHAARLWCDEGTTVQEDWATFRDRCDCAAFDEPGATACDGSCDCGGMLAPCGDDWPWLVEQRRAGTPGAVAVSWVVLS